jgi:hypothetical protein
MAARHDPLMSCVTLIETPRAMQVGVGAPARIEIHRLLARGFKGARSGL